MEKRTNGTRFLKFSRWGQPREATYDYMQKGIKQHLFSRHIAESKNETLYMILKFFEKTTFFLLKYIDELKYFKDYNRKNR